MQRTPPRHLAPPIRSRPRARDHLLVESILAMVAIVLTTAIVIGSLMDRPESSAARLPNLRPPAPAPTTSRAAASTTPQRRVADGAAKGNLLTDPGFEAGLAGWRALGGTLLERVGEAREGSWAVRLARGPGITLAEVTKAKRDKAYVATAWVRASQPGTTIQVNLYESLGGKRFAVDTVGAVVGETGWQRLEVAHDAHRAGATVAVEILAPDLTGGSSVLVDDLAIQAKAAPFMSAP
jgi:hypothetical protein